MENNILIIILIITLIILTIIVFKYKSLKNFNILKFFSGGNFDPNNINIITLSGREGAGKSTISTYLDKQYGFKTYAFADRVRDVVSAFYGFDRKKMNGITEEDREYRINVRDPAFNHNGRKGMQEVADAFKNKYGRDVWARIVIGNIVKQINEGTLQNDIIISDLRYVDEYNALHAYVDEFNKNSLNKKINLQHIVVYNDEKHLTPTDEERNDPLIHDSVYSWADFLNKTNATLIYNERTNDKIKRVENIARVRQTVEELLKLK